jgi:uncharacterized protein (DUF1810 family)
LIGRAFDIRDRWRHGVSSGYDESGTADKAVLGIRKGARVSDSFELRRFVDAQASVYPRVVEELSRGRKRSHWMWFVFPQIRGLGSSRMAQAYAIASLEEAVAYLKHPILGPRLRECTRLVNEVQGRSIEDIFGDPDFMKFRSSMTLFAHATSDSQVFLEALQKYYDGEQDESTVEKL